VLVSEVTRGLLQALPEGCSLLDLGVHRLTDLDEPERLSQVMHAALPSSFPPVRSTSAGTTVLPIPPTTLVGRDDEVASLTALVLREDVRLVTVIGPGGVGKTRLALAVAERAATEFADGVVFAALASISDPMLVPTAIAGAAGLREAGSADLSGLTQWLRQRELLVVVDNFEQVVDAAPTLVVLLRDCPGVRMLVTSRGALRVAGEATFPLSPLAVPADGDVASAPSVDLFVQRALAVRPDYDVHKELAVVAELCRRLDGLPLALELAAASVRLLSPQAMLERLDHGQPALASGNRDAPDRHASLTHAIEWSYQLLTVPQRRLYRWLAVFSGGCTIAAAEAVLSVSGDFLGLLDGLVSQSLVQTEPTGHEVRLRMLETIAEDGRQRLSAAGEQAAARDAHAGYFLRLAQGATLELRSARRDETLECLERDHSNLREALSHLIAAGATEDVLKMAAALARFWHDHGHLDEGRALLAAALHAGATSRPELRMPVVLGAAALAYEDDCIDEAADLAATALSDFRRRGDVRGCVDALEVLAAVDRFRGDRVAARQRYSEAASLAAELDDEWLAAHLMERQGVAAWAAGDYPSAEALLTDSLHRFRSLGDVQGAAFALWSLGSTDAVDGRVRLGIRRMEEAVPILRQGRHRRELGRALCNLGLAYVQVGDMARAEPALLEGTLTFREVKLGRHLSSMFPAFAALALANGDARRAARLLGATEHVWAASGWQPPVMLSELWDRCARQASRDLGAKSFEDAKAQGAFFTLDDALDEAIHLSTGAPAGLTTREHEVILLLAEGLSNAEISARLFLSVRTVHAHLRSLYTKLEVGSRTAAVRRATDLGLVDLGRHASGPNSAIVPMTDRGAHP
jgi:predicted ATPase/DNA-binding CsgD family transcriptional regulator